MELVSRQTQLARLEGLLSKTLHGQMQIALITGEAGIGKTTLLDTFLAAAQQQHPELFVIRSKCFEMTGTGQDPYAPFIQLLDGIASGKKNSITWDRLRLSLLELAPDWLQQITGGNLGSAVIPPLQWTEKGDYADKQRRMVQFANALRLASSTAPMLMAIDDLHWSDQASLDLLSFLADQLSSSPILLVLAYRPVEIMRRLQGDTHPVRRLVNQLKRYARCVEIDVPNLSLNDIQDLLTQQHFAFSPEFVERLCQRSSGNPFYIREFLQLLQSRGLVQREQGQMLLTCSPEVIDFPPTIEAVIEQRLDLVAGDLRQLLAYASVQGERFASQVLSGTIKEIPESNILRYLNQLDEDYRLVNQLEDQRLVVKVGQEFRFVHALLQQVLYQDLSESQRRLLHQVIARLQESLYGEQVGRHAVGMANHYELGGNLLRAVSYYAQACQNALALHALDDALELARKAQDLSRQMQTSDHRANLWLAQALLQEAEIHFWKGDYRSVLTTVYDGERICEQYNLPEPNAGFHYWQARALRALNQNRESIEAAQKALNLLGTECNSRLHGLLHAYLGGVSDSLPLDALNQHLDESLRIAETGCFPDVKVKALLEKAGLAIYRTDHPAETLEHARKAAEIAADNGMFNEQVTACRLEAFAHLRLGHFNEALTCDQKAVDTARQHGLPVALHLALFSLSISWASGMDNPAKGIELLHESLEVARQYNFLPSRNVFGALFNIAFAVGQWDEARDAQLQFYKSIIPTYPRGMGYHLRMRGHDLLAHGQSAAAVEAYQEAIILYRKHSPDNRDVRTVEPYLGQALVESGSDLAARSLLEDTCDFWKGRQSSRYARSLCALAEISLKRGDCKQAIPLLRQALLAAEGSASEHPWPIRPQVSLLLTRALLLNQEPEEAILHAQWAHERYKRMGHYLSGDAAYWLGQVYLAFDKPRLADTYLIEARQKWTDLGLDHRLELISERD
jgi:tetratricopeptide (TPR) repeat protein